MRKHLCFKQLCSLHISSNSENTWSNTHSTFTAQISENTKPENERLSPESWSYHIRLALLWHTEGL